MDIINPLVYGVPCFLILIAVELLHSKKHKNGDPNLYQFKDMFTSMGMGLGAVILAPLIKVISAAAIFTVIFNLFNPLVDGVRVNILGYESFKNVWDYSSTLTGVGVFLLCQLLDDFAYYWFHRLNHTCRFLWAAHIVHHSSDHYNFGTGLRNGWFTLFYKPLFYMWIPAIGFPPEMVVLTLGVEALWQFQLHTTHVPKMGFIEKIFNTHTMHQAHHEQNIEYLDKNHGGYLNIFDKIFGTWKELDDDVDVKYGVIHAPDSNNPFVVLTHEYSDIWKDVKKSKNIKEVFMYSFGPPGWSPDGSTLTVKQIHRKMKEGWTIEQLQAKA